MKQKRERIKTLDTLRGLAAFSVLFGHCLVVFPAFWTAVNLGPVANVGVQWMAYTPLRILWDGHAAVIFFFVLSGFVLMLPYTRKDPLGYGAYLIRRICRIYLPYLALILLSLLFVALRWCPTGIQGASEWTNEMWRVPLTAGRIFQILTMYGYTYDLAPTTWSLIHEMRISIFFPLLALGVLRSDWKVTLAVGLGVYGTGWVIMQRPDLSFGNWDKTYYCSSFFILGALLAKYRSNIVPVLKKTPRMQILFVSILSILLYGWKGWVISLGPLYLSFVGDNYSDLANAIASLLFIGLVLSRKGIQKKLSQEWLFWLGDVSYSLYLIHPMVVLICLYYLTSFMPLILSDMIGLAFSLVAAGFFHQWVEKPAMNLGKSMTRTPWI